MGLNSVADMAPHPAWESGEVSGLSDELAAEGRLPVGEAIAFASWSVA